MVLVVIAGAVTYAYRQYPEARMEIRIFQKSLKIKAATEKLIADNTCSDELKKADCFSNFILVMGGVEFSSDLALFTRSSYRICYKNPSCVMANTFKLLSQFNVKNLWVFQEPKSDPDFYAASVRIEKGLVDKYLRAIRKTATEKFQIETDDMKKNNLLQYIKAIDAKIVEVSQAQ